MNDILQIGIKNKRTKSYTIKKIYRDVTCLFEEIPVIVECDKILKTFIETQLKSLLLSTLFIYIIYVL